MAKAASVPSVLDPRCPSRLVLDRIADKWTALVIQILAGGTMRYAALQREIGGISQKMLTQTLRSLERDGLVHRMKEPVEKLAGDAKAVGIGERLFQTNCSQCHDSRAAHRSNRAQDHSAFPHDC